MKAIEATLGSCATSGARDRSNRRRVTLWTFVWMLTWLGATAAIKFEVLPTGWPAVLVTLITGVLGAVTFAVYRRYLLEADELRRKIELDALAIAFGVGIVGGLTYWLAGHAGAFAKADPLVIPVAMLFTHGIAVIVGQRRYS